MEVLVLVSDGRDVHLLRPEFGNDDLRDTVCEPHHGCSIVLGEVGQAFHVRSRPDKHVAGPDGIVQDHQSVCVAQYKRLVADLTEDAIGHRSFSRSWLTLFLTATVGQPRIDLDGAGHLSSTGANDRQGKLKAMTADRARLMVDLLAGIAELEGEPLIGAEARDRLFQTFVGGTTIEEAIIPHLLALKPRHRARIFGRSKLRPSRQKRVLIGSLNGQHLCLSFGDLPGARITGDVVILEVQRECLVLSMREGRRTTTLAAMAVGEMLAAIALHGSVWDSIFPAYHGMVLETLSLTLPPAGRDFLFADVDPSDDARARLTGFASPSTRLRSLHDVAAMLCGDQDEVAVMGEARSGDRIFRKYHFTRSELLNFGAHEEHDSRDDFVIVHDGPWGEQHHEFAIVPEEWPDDSKQLRLTCFNLLNMLAIRRAKLFRTGFGSRVYNLMFPPILLVAADESGADYAMFPSLNLYRGQGSGFRRTASLSFTILPVRRSRDAHFDARARLASLREIHQLKDALDRSLLAARNATTDRYRLRSVADGFYRNLSDEMHLALGIQAIATDIAQRAYGSEVDAQFSGSLQEMVGHARTESRMTTVLLQVGWCPTGGDNQPWERWLAGKEDRTFEDALYRTLFYKDFLFPSSAYASRQAIQLREFNVGNTLGADMTGMTLFNPQDRLKVCLYSESFEAYPNYSIVRWATWQVYIDSALTAMRALIFKFHPLMDNTYSLRSIMTVLRQMLREFVEFYDLDIREFFYRKEYEKLRERFNVEADYRQLREKFSAAKEDELLREQRVINKLIVAFTVATVVITAISTIAQMNQIETGTYLVLAGIAVGVLTPLGYVLFDPLKQALSRLASAVTRGWRRLHERR